MTIDADFYGQKSLCIVGLINYHEREFCSKERKSTILIVFTFLALETIGYGKSTFV